MKDIFKAKNIFRGLVALSLAGNVAYIKHLTNHSEQEEPINKALIGDLPESKPEFQRTGVVNFADDGTPYWQYYDPEGSSQTCLGVEDIDGQTKNEAEDAIGVDPKKQQGY